MRSVERHYVKKKQCHLARCSRKSSICEKKVPDRASSEGCTIRQVEILSNKLLTTAFEASLECVTVM